MKVRHFGAPTVKLPWGSGADNARVEVAGAPARIRRRRPPPGAILVA
jgi:hypothetical protein